jgi:hypothetical protein
VQQDAERAADAADVDDGVVFGRDVGFVTGAILGIVSS